MRQSGTAIRFARRSRPDSVRALAWVLVLLIFTLQAGCQSWNIDSARKTAGYLQWTSPSPIKVRKRPENPLARQLSLMSIGGPKPTDRTTQLLRRMDLLDSYNDSPDNVLKALHEGNESKPQLMSVYAVSELTYIEGESARGRGDDMRAIPMYLASISQAYRYLFATELDEYRNTFDPEFRRVCDLYNKSLEGLLRILRKNGKLNVGEKQNFVAFGREIQMDVTAEGSLANRRFDTFDFVADYETHGLNNTYRTYGLGVPMIAAVNGHSKNDPSGKFYPPLLTLPMSAFMTADNITFDPQATDSTIQCTIRLFDPLERTTVAVGKQQAPLESDISTPLAYFLNDPLLNTNVIATFALLNADFARNIRGLYMLEPYNPDKIPVLMVHGLWSSPLTWTEMYNDLRADKNLRDKYQFWFYLYPTGQPFWVSAQQLRHDLDEAINVLDPSGQSGALQRMVLVGHSMGGLVSRLQTLDSSDQFWNLVSEKSIDDLKADNTTRTQLRDTWYFSPNPSVRRVITLGTPHHGSSFANPTTRWFAKRFFRLPSFLREYSSEIVRENPGAFKNKYLAMANTSIDSLAPESPYFEAMRSARSARWVKYHNVIGRSPKRDIFSLVSRKLYGDGDGVVTLDSARSNDTESTLEVPAEHIEIHQHPNSIMEVRRILFEHLAELESAGNQGMVVPVGYETGQNDPYFQYQNSPDTLGKAPRNHPVIEHRPNLENRGFDDSRKTPTNDQGIRAAEPLRIKNTPAANDKNTPAANDKNTPAANDKYPGSNDKQSSKSESPLQPIFK